MIRLTTTSAPILIISAIIISLSLVAIRIKQDDLGLMDLLKLRKRSKVELLRVNIINQMDSTAAGKYVLVKKFKNDTWDKKMAMPQEPKTYQDMVTFVKYEKFWFKTYDYKIEIATKTKATRLKEDR